MAQRTGLTEGVLRLVDRLVEPPLGEKQLGPGEMRDGVVRVDGERARKVVCGLPEVAGAVRGAEVEEATDRAKGKLDQRPGINRAAQTNERTIAIRNEWSQSMKVRSKKR